MPNGSLSRRDFLQRSTAACGTLAALPQETQAQDHPAPDAPANADDRPNILFIMTDQQRFDCLGANGNPLIRTPHLDALAAQSANFQNTFVQAPVCVPSRGCFFTGRYAHCHRNRVNYTPLPANETLMQQHFQAAGYATASVGKLHLYPPTAEEAHRSGFQHVQLHDGVRTTDPYSDYVKWRRQHDPQHQVPYRAVVKQVEPGQNPHRTIIDEQYTDTSWTGLKTREALQSLGAGRQPFFLYSSYWKPHSPFEVPAPFESLYNDVEIPLPKRYTLADIQKLPWPLQKLILRFTPRYNLDREQLQWIYRSYYASITHIDREVGLTMQALKATGRADNTVVVFASDHGDQLLEHGLMGKNVFFEASIRVPCMVSFPGRVQPGKYHELIETIDLLPTLFEYAGINVPPHCQGRSFASLIQRTTLNRQSPSQPTYQPREQVFCENIIPEVITKPNNMTFRFDKNQGIAGIRHPDAKMIRTYRWKLNHYPGHGGELYDLKNDPHEDENLIDNQKQSGVVADLKERLLNWMITADETEQIAEKWLL